MANDVLKLTWAADGDADETTLNLLDFVQGLTLDEGGWTPQIATGDQATVTETMTFHAKALTHDQLAGYVQVLDDWIFRVNWSHDFTQRQFVWINARWKSETSMRRAVVYSLAYSLGNGSSPFGVYLRDDSFVPTLTIVIVRAAYWEDTQLTSISSSPGNKSVVGGTCTFIAGGQPYSGFGDVPSRIGYMNLTINDAGLRYFWFGFRTSREGVVVANFVPVWNLNSSGWLKNVAHGEFANDTVITVDATANSGNRLTTDFSGGATLLRRAAISTSDVSGTPEDQRGLFKCLLRARMSDASIARVRVSSGFCDGSFSGSAYFINPRSTISGTSWFLYDMGIVRIPGVQREYISLSVIDEAAILIDAERVSGAGNLYMDCLILIPYNDSYAYADNGGGTTLYILTSPDFVSAAYSVPGILPSVIEPSGWGYPAYNEVPTLIIAGQRGTSHVLTDTITLNGKVVPRWRTLRGNE